MQVLHVCSEMFPLLKRADWRMFLVHYRRANCRRGGYPRCCYAFPDIRRGIPDAKVVTRRETFTGRITRCLHITMA